MTLLDETSNLGAISCFEGLDDDGVSHNFARWDTSSSVNSRAHDVSTIFPSVSNFTVHMLSVTSKCVFPTDTDIEFHVRTPVNLEPLVLCS